ncbi:MAG: diguanylate cyclase [Actinomycetota bacterium]|nr:diguanylate cyclase [Actinomycetota bacterium]
MHPDVAPGAQVSARVAAVLYALGGAISLLVVLAPHPEQLFAEGFVAVAVVAELVAVGLWLADRRVSKRLLNWIVAGGSLLITADIAMAGEHLGAAMPDNEMLYVWVALYAAYFFTARQAALHVTWASALYGGALWFFTPHEVLAARWLETTSTLGISVMLIVLLKRRVRSLLTALADAARTDPLTGLNNRRGFEESIEVEIERARRGGHPLTLLLGDLDHFKRVNDQLGHGAGDAALSRVGRLLRDGKRQIDYAARTGGEEFALILPETNEQQAYVLAERLRTAVQGAFAGELVPLTFSFGIAGFPHHGRTSNELLRSADRGLYAAKELGRNRAVIYSSEIASVSLPPGATARGVHLDTLLSLAEAIDLRDAGTADHAQTVGRHCALMARELGLPRECVERVRLAGLLHDVGKIGISDAILRKPGPLDDAEWAEMRRHPEIGARILGASEFDDIREWVLAHHERPDGRGYPFGLRGDEIPLEAKILAVGDAYEAMTCDRVYRAAIGVDAARDELRRGAGSQFDGLVVEALLRVLDSASATMGAAS